MRIIMFGTGPFAVPTFQSLMDSSHDVLALVTRPIADAGKRRKTAENPTRDLGESREIRVFDPASCNSESFVQQLGELAADLFVVCDYGQILSRSCLAAARLGGINLHGSLLPKYRGASPINWAIYQGETHTGITIIHMTAKLDGGPCLVQESMDIGSLATAADLEPQLAQLGVEPVHRAIGMLAIWDGESPLGEKQDPAAATNAPRLKKSDGLIDWSRPASSIVNQIRALQPWPGTFTYWHAAHLKQPLRLIVHRAVVAHRAGGVQTSADAAEISSPADDSQPVAASHRLAPGQVAISNKNRLMIQTGDGLLSMESIQPAGKRVMSIEEFLRGHQPAIGDQFE